MLRMNHLNGFGVGRVGTPGGGPPPPTYPLDGLSPSGAWSLSRDLLTAYIGGTRYIDASGVHTLNDQSGNTRNLTVASEGSAKPALATAGPNSRECADFDGTATG